MCIQHETQKKVCTSSFTSHLPSKSSIDHRKPVLDLVNKNGPNLQSLITACDIPANLEKKLKALQTIDHAFNIFVSETGKLSLKYDNSKTRISLQYMCHLIFEIPRINFTTQVKVETFEKLARKQKDSKGCLIRYRRHDLEGPYYIQCWIHKCLIIILAYGDKSNTSCAALLTWIKPKGKHETEEGDNFITTSNCHKYQ